ncbi:MAG: glycosyltransferase [bacterium]|nr:glycosyltransferase [bacterium]
MTRTVFLLNTITSWDEPPRARHQLAQALAESHDVVFVARNRTGRPRLDTAAVSDRLTVVTPTWPLDYRFRYRTPVVNEIYQDWLYRRLAALYPDADVVNFDQTATRLVRRYPGFAHFCNDELVGNSRYRFPPVDWYHAWCERRVAHAARLVATAPYLVEKFRRWNPRTFEIPLGAPSVPDDLIAACTPVRDPRRMTLGLVGFMGKRTPAHLLNELTADDRVKLILIGPCDPGFTERLEHVERVDYRGVLRGPELFATLCGIDVALAPYVPAYINRGGTPNKLWQYLAVGKPVVVTDLPSMRHWRFPPGCVYVAANEEEFAALVRKAYAEDDTSKVRTRIACAQDNSWRRRAEQLMGLMGDGGGGREDQDSRQRR